MADAATEHSALVAEVTAQLAIDDEFIEWLRRNPSQSRRAHPNSVSRAELLVRSHRQALETLNRHAPIDEIDGCGTCGNCVTVVGGEVEWVPDKYPCDEVAGVRAVYLPEK